jgi:colanic acid biosynthesis protein WcaH
VQSSQRTKSGFSTSKLGNYQGLTYLQNANSYSKSCAFRSSMHIPQDIYAQIVRLMPISCVDLLVQDEDGRVLLIKRANEPARGHWWFPGGRVHFLETRDQAAKRKLTEECGLAALQVKEMGTYDVILDMPDDANQSHGITTLFNISVMKQGDVILDAQSIDYEWRRPEEWLYEPLHFFIRQIVKVYAEQTDEKK